MAVPVSYYIAWTFYTQIGDGQSGITLSLNYSTLSSLLFLYLDHLIARKSLLTWVLLNLQLHMQSVPNTTNAINSNSTWVYSIHYVIKLVSDLWKVDDFLRVLWFPPSNKADVHEYENIAESGIKPFCNKIKLFSYLVT